MKPIFTLCFLFFCASTFAQNPLPARLSGQVVDQQNRQPVAGAVLYWKKQRLTEIADKEGRFSLPFSQNDSLLVSNIGFKSQWLVGIESSHSTLSISLERDTVNLPPLVLKASGRKFPYTLQLGPCANAENNCKKSYWNGVAGEITLLPIRIDTINARSIRITKLIIPTSRPYTIIEGKEKMVKGRMKKEVYFARSDAHRQASCNLLIQESTAVGDSFVIGRSLLPFTPHYLVRKDQTIELDLSAYNIRPGSTHILVGMQALGGRNMQTGLLEHGPGYQRAAGKVGSYLVYSAWKGSWRMAKIDDRTSFGLPNFSVQLLCE